MVTLNLSRIRWFDLWPLAQLAKLLHHRLVLSKRPTIINLPYLPHPVDYQFKFKPLCFLVDIGFLGLFVCPNYQIMS